MQRRKFISTLCGGAALALPFVARAQQSPIPVIGYLGNSSPEKWASRLQAFRKGLSDTGFIDGTNVGIEYRWSDGQYDRLPELAADLVRRRVNVIFAPGSTPAAWAAKAATQTIPIVFENGADPVSEGLVASWNRPGGNVTGVSSLNNLLAPKRLEVLHETLPSMKLVAALFNPLGGKAVEHQKDDLQKAASALGLELVVVTAINDHELEPAFSTYRQRRAGGMVIMSEALYFGHMEQLGELTLRYEVPAIFQNREFAAAGGLMSYGGDVAETHALAGQYVGRILKGAKPADLAVIQGSKVELIINLKSAKTLGIAMPSVLLGRADEIIE